jgi:hypothetical protein
MAVSSLKPFANDTAYKEHQLRAYDSWHPMFSQVVYMSHQEDALISPKIKYIGTVGWPRIKEMVAVASKLQSDYVAIINSDIWLHPRFQDVIKSMGNNQVIGSTSRRFSYDHPNFSDAKIIDHGMDVFITTPRVWKKVHQHIPESLRVGHYLWDTWMSGFLNDFLKSKMVDFTSYRCVFHPIHGGRENPHAQEIKANDRYLRAAGFPGHKLK